MLSSVTNMSETSATITESQRAPRREALGQVARAPNAFETFFPLSLSRTSRSLGIGSPVAWVAPSQRPLAKHRRQTAKSAAAPTARAIDAARRSKNAALATNCMVIPAA